MKLINHPFFKEMNRFRRTAFSVVSLAVLMVFFASWMPHHHHGKEACLTYEVCDVDGALNDEHTDHQCHQEANHSPEGKDTCSLTIQDWVRPSVEIQSVSCYLDIQFLFNEYFYQFAPIEERNLTPKAWVNEAIHFRDFYAFPSFRAPPVG